MPRANRYITEGVNFHVTHRCHNRQFLLRFGKDRDAYRNMLRELLPGSRVQLYGYCLTSNHVHLLLHSESPQNISALMKPLAGEFAQAYNQRKKRGSAYWGDRFHATLVDDTDYLWRCLLYIDMNMVRAGVVEHPQDWDWCGYRELMGLRKRYRLIDVERLLHSVDMPSVDEFRKRYDAALNYLISERQLAREAHWTESMAVGSDAFVRRIERSLKNRKRVTYSQDELHADTYCLREAGGEGYQWGDADA